MAMPIEEIQKQLQHSKHKLKTLAHSIGYKGIRSDMAYYKNLINLYSNKLKHLNK